MSNIPLHKTLGIVRRHFLVVRAGPLVPCGPEYICRPPRILQPQDRIVEKGARESKGANMR